MKKLTLTLFAIITLISIGFAVETFYTSRNEVPEWENPEEFEKDVFCFARVRYSSWGRGNRWATDYPDSDLNFSYRLQQMTTIKVDPNPVIVEFTEPEIANYPFLYVVEPGRMDLTPEERKGAKDYLDNGGFILFDDFWGYEAWENLKYNFKRIYPDRDFVELDVKHPIFNMVYNFDKKPQVPAINVAINGRAEGITWEMGEEGRHVHYQALFDDNGKMIALACHNTDLGDGWEREGENAWYFKEFSEKKAFPMGVNIITYILTH
ncbi:MAG: DUF4159 domain-containing protein [Lentisphaeraceae bacterium]|nr:DUF4159 domain-containing protein [Lentisphaeraceae bacterium]